MARTPLRRRILSMTVIYSVMLIGVVFILTWRTNNTQREIERIVRLQTRAMESLRQFKVFHATLQTQWSRMARERPDELPSAIDHYLGLAGQNRDVLRTAEGAPPEIALESESLDRMAVVTRERWVEMSASERDIGLAVLLAQIRKIVRLTDDATLAANRDIDARMNALVRDGRNTMWTALGAAYIIAVMGIAVARNALKKVVRPLEDLWRAAESLAEGEYSTRAPVAGDREIYKLGQAFNEMAGKIEAAVDATEQRARTDDLTGLPNFRAFSEAIEAEILRAGRYETQFGLLVFDIDHFKKYNDSFGHLAGNEALQLVSSTIRKTLRTVDLAARYGGEEFAAILPEVNEEGMRLIGERSRRAVQNLPPLEGRRRITLSIGGAIFPEDGRNPEALFEAADRRLYEAKEKGRNMVVTPVARSLERSRGRAG